MSTKFNVQAIPDHIIRQVTCYILEPPNDSSNLPVNIIETANDRIDPLLAVSHAWRSAALSLKFSKCNVFLNEAISLAYYFNNTEELYADSPDPHCYDDFIKHVALCFEYHNFIDGTIVHNLETTDIDQLCFPNARSLEVKILFSADSDVNYEHAVCNTEILTDYFRDMMPMANKVKISLVDNTSALFQPDIRLLKPFLGYISEWPNVELYMNNFEQPIFDSFTNANALSTLYCQWGHDFESVAMLIYKNSKSLVELSVKYHHFTDFSKLLVNNGKNITYPYLEKLYLRKSCTENMPKQLSIAQIAPFPRLARLHIYMQYPFGDDLPFRGNGGTMQDLCIPSDESIISMLNSDVLFSKSRLRSLDKLTLGKFSNSSNSFMADNSTIKRFIKKVLPSLRFLIILDPNAHQAFIDFTITSKPYLNLNMLSLINGPLSLEECMRILLLFPALNKLSCHITKFGSKFSEWSIAKVGNTLRTRYKSHNNHLRMITLVRANEIPENILVPSILLLANMCLNLNRVKLVSMLTEEADNMFLKLSTADAYSDIRAPIVPRLRLVCNKYSYTNHVISIQRETPASDV